MINSGMTFIECERNDQVHLVVFLPSPLFDMEGEGVREEGMTC